MLDQQNSPEMKIYNGAEEATHNEFIKRLKAEIRTH
jgi:hypothetical protein